jgi:hypothetical protein
MSQEILRVREEPVSPEHACTKRNSRNITKKCKKLKKALERSIIIR